MRVLVIILSLIGLAATASGQITVTGFYGTGFKTTGAAMTQGSYTDSAWSVTGAKTNGATDTSDGRGDYLGLAYEVGSANLPGAWATALGGGGWITTHKNAGGDPNVLGSGTSFAANGASFYQAGAYVYELSFTINGGSGGLINNSLFAINFSLAADDTYAVFVNQTASTILSGSQFTGNGTLASSAAGSSSSTYYGSTTAVTIRSSSTNSTGFGAWQYGTNTIDILVLNTGGTSGASTSTTTNPSGLLVYGFYSVIPEPQTYLQTGGLIALIGYLKYRRRRRR